MEAGDRGGQDSTALILVEEHNSGGPCHMISGCEWDWMTVRGSDSPGFASEVFLLEDQIVRRTLTLSQGA